MGLTGPLKGKLADHWPVLASPMVRPSACEKRAGLKRTEWTWYIYITDMAC